MIRRSAPVGRRRRRGELAVAVADQEPELLGAVAEVHQEVGGLLGDPGAGGVGGDPRDVRTAAVVFDDDEDVEAAQEHGVDEGEVEREDRTGLRDRTCRRGGPVRRGAGSSPTSFKIFQTVAAATEWPSPTNSPWIRL
jgi:hypothetical protein